MYTEVNTNIHFASSLPRFCSSVAVEIILFTAKTYKRNEKEHMYRDALWFLFCLFSIRRKAYGDHLIIRY